MWNGVFHPDVTRRETGSGNTGAGSTTEGSELPCSKSFGERCALEGLLEGVVSPNAAKSASMVTNVPCRPLCEGYFHQTILNNCHEYTKMHRNPLTTTPFDFAITLSAGWCCPMTHREKREAKWQIQGLKLTHSMKHSPLQISNHMPKHLIKQDPFDLSAENGQKTDYLCISL